MFAIALYDKDSCTVYWWSGGDWQANLSPDFMFADEASARAELANAAIGSYVVDLRSK